MGEILVSVLDNDRGEETRHGGNSIPWFSGCGEIISNDPSDSDVEGTSVEETRPMLVLLSDWWCRVRRQGSVSKAADVDEDDWASVDNLGAGVIPIASWNVGGG